VSVRGADVRRQQKKRRGSSDGADQQPDALPVSGAGDVEAASIQHRQAAGQSVADGGRSSLGP